MRALFDVTHPALVHLFAPAAEALEAGGHDVTVAAREKDVTTDLLDAAGVPYAVVSHAGAGPLSRIGELLEREIGLVRLARRIDPDVVVSQVDPAAVHAARLVGARAVVFDDSEHERLVAGLTHRFADVVCTPSGSTATCRISADTTGSTNSRTSTRTGSRRIRRRCNDTASTPSRRTPWFDSSRGTPTTTSAVAGSHQRGTATRRTSRRARDGVRHGRGRTPTAVGGSSPPGRGDTRPVGVRGLLRGRLADDGDRGRGARNARGADERVRWRRRHEQLPELETEYGLLQSFADEDAASTAPSRSSRNRHVRRGPGATERHAEQGESFPIDAEFMRRLFEEPPDGTVRPVVCRCEGSSRAEKFCSNSAIRRSTGSAPPTATSTSRSRTS